MIHDLGKLVSTSSERSDRKSCDSRLDKPWESSNPRYNRNLLAYQLIYSYRKRGNNLDELNLRYRSYANIEIFCPARLYNSRFQTDYFASFALDGWSVTRSLHCDRRRPYRWVSLLDMADHRLGFSTYSHRNRKNFPLRLYYVRRATREWLT